MSGENRGGHALPSRRSVLRAGVYGAGLGAVAPALLASPATPIRSDRILVTVELAGGNDGLDTLIPYRDDAYQSARPTLRHPTRDLHRLSDTLALHPALDDWHRMWDDGRLAVVQGCGAPRQSRSHFAAMALWHSADCAAGGATGWLGRLADAAWPHAGSTALATIGLTPSPAVRSRLHPPVVLSDRRTPLEDGLGPLATDLRRIAGLIASGFPARVYTVSLGGFDTHAAQPDARRPLLAGVGAALRAFHRDLDRLGRGRDVATLVFSEFGRRLEENASLGTDHGTAGPMFLLGEAVVPGLFGRHPSLTELDRDGDLEITTDFRRVYASVIEEWFGLPDAAVVLRERFEPLGVFAARAT